MTDEDEERIVNAENPRDEVVKMFDKAKEKTIITRQKQAMKDFEEALQKLKDGTLEWR
jgi:RNA polymerase-binding transcription factor DksA